MTDVDSIPFRNSYAELPGRFFQRVLPQEFAQPKLLAFNDILAENLNLEVSESELAELFSGQKLSSQSKPLAMAYAGHQFGHFVPQLGDGRALLLGELVSSNGKLYELQLKGSGPTQFSRGGDGLSWVGPVIREYLVSEAMFHMGVSTTRSLAAVWTGDDVLRETNLPGAVLTRVSRGHIRVGSFEYFASRGDTEAVQLLADFCIDRFYPSLKQDTERHIEFFDRVLHSQAHLVAHWMSIGFIHGVMNTDNTSIAGETIDYGPCAFMDKFDANKVFSSIDRRGRYAYKNQAAIAQWNMARLADCLVPIVSDDEQSAIDLLSARLDRFQSIFEAEWLRLMGQKLGILEATAEDSRFIEKWLRLLQENQLDFTLSFRNLASWLEDPEEFRNGFFISASGFSEFAHQLKERLGKQPQPLTVIIEKMNEINPLYIPRNHLIERAIDNCVKGDDELFHQLATAWRAPFTYQEEFDQFKHPPQSHEVVKQTFCGT